MENISPIPKISEMEVYFDAWNICQKNPQHLNYKFSYTEQV